MNSDIPHHLVFLHETWMLASGSDFTGGVKDKIIPLIN